MAGLAAVIACTALIPGLSGGWLFDDFGSIVTNRAVDLTALDYGELRRLALSFGIENGGLPRPIAMLSFGLNAYFGDGTPWAFKTTNLAIHAVNGVLVATLTSLIWGWLRPGTQANWLMLAGVSIAWTAHPLQASTVLYVVQRMEMLCATFTLISLIAYLRWRIALRDGSGWSAWGWIATSALSAVLALLSKETAVLIPLYVLVLEFTVLSFHCGSSVHSNRLRIAGWACLAVALVAYFAANIHYAGHTGYLARDFSATDRLLSQPAILTMYLGQTLMPSIERMPFYYDQLVAPSATDIRAWVATGALAGLAGAAFLLRRRAPELMFGVTWFLAAHAITSSTAPLELAFEHRNYLALLGPLVALIWGSARALGTERARLHHALTVVAILVCTGLGALRANYWGDVYALAHLHAELNPESARAQMDLGEQFMALAQHDPSSPFYTQAVEQFERVAALPNNTILGEHGLILMAASFGAAAKQDWWNSLIAKLEERPIKPQDVDALNGMTNESLAGLKLDAIMLSRANLIAARRGRLSTPLLFVSAQHALTVAKDRPAAIELFARALEGAERTDPAYAMRARRGIESLGGQQLMADVDAWMPHRERQL